MGFYDGFLHIRYKKSVTRSRTGALSQTSDATKRWSNWLQVLYLYIYPYIHNSLSEKESNITNYVKPLMRHLFSSRSRIISTSQVSTSKTGQTLVPCISTYLLSLLDKRLDKFPVTACSRYPGKMERIVSPSVAHTRWSPVVPNRSALLLESPDPPRRAVDS